MAPTKKLDEAESKRRKRDYIIQQMVELSGTLSIEFVQTLDEAAVQVRLEQVDRLEKRLEAAQAHLEDEDDADSVLANFSTQYIEAKTKLTRQLYNCRSSEAHRSTMRPSFEEHPSVIFPPPKQRLPVLQIPKFSGTYTEWPDFYSMFRTIIHQDAELSKVEKFQHLRSNLRDAALDTIRSLEISEQNYDKAHVRDIFQLSSVDGDSVAMLRGLSDKVNAHLRALQTMGTKEQMADGLLIHLVSQKLDVTSRSKWEEETPTTEIPAWSTMATFLERRCQQLENVENALVTKTPSKEVGKKPYFTHNRKALVASSANGCLICGSNKHTVWQCENFIRLSPLMRYNEAKRLQLCLNCLRSGHSLKVCKSGCCRHCSAKHHTLLHQGLSQSVSVAQTPNALNSLAADRTISPSLPSSARGAETMSPPSLQPASTLVSSAPEDIELEKEFVLLATAVVFIKNRAGSLIPCRALLDSASQLNFVTTRLANQLQIKKSRATTSISGIGQTEVIADHIVDLEVHSRLNSYTALISAVVTPTITDSQPGSSLKNIDWNIPPNIRLADPLFFESQRIDILIGASLFFDLLCVGQIRLREELPLLQKTKLGWVVSGGGTRKMLKPACLAAIGAPVEHDLDHRLDHLVKRFWEVENCADSGSKITAEEIKCEKHFIENFQRLESGSYSERLPIKSSVDQLGDSYQQALSRFKNLERKLQRNPELKQQYSSFIKEYLDLNHMSPVNTMANQIPINFLPHHCVLKADSTTTKLRVVFDGSVQTTSGFSLNDILMAGPTIQRNLFDILLQFRSFKIALTGDICKMYRCIRISHPDNFLQCILWRDHPNEEINVFKLDTVTYGTKPASFLAIRAMQQLAADEGQAYPLGAKIICRDFYVDDMISGANSVAEARAVLHQTRALLAAGRFELRKFCSNDQRVLADVADVDKENFLKFHDGTGVVKTLGLVWEPSADIFIFSFMPNVAQTKTTKRSVLSIIARLYDPLGLIGPIVAKAKIFLQHLWKEKLHWDESLPQSLQSAWVEICNEYQLVDRFNFDRYILLPGASVEIHAFCDASLAAYGVCLYIRAEKSGVVRTNLLCSKSRVAPLKTLTVPKLELSAALLLAELVATVSKLNIFEGEFHCWSDLTVVLSLLRNESSNFNIFVSNRICSIQTLTNGMSWRYVPSELNPADILSKGSSPKELLNLSLWKHGPEFLRSDRRKWPASPALSQDLPERRKGAFVTAVPVDFTTSCKLLHSFGRMQRVYSYIYRFTRSAATRCSGKLTTWEIHQGTFLLIRMVQRVHLHKEYNSLKRNLDLSGSSDILPLNPFIDEYGLIRVGGRLQNSLLEFGAKHPIILPKRHPVTDSIISNFHRRMLHAGPQSLLASIRLQYWPLGGKRTVARVVNKCIRCFRAKPKLMEHIMGNLPPERVQPYRAFLITGVDFCGPFYHQSEVRNRAPIKCYVCLFICFSTKAVHLELVKDLSTPSFLAALRRFICTRGKPQVIWSDNATNFVGAKNELKELKELFFKAEHMKAVHEQCLHDGIDWRFIPARSPHFGGLWEASIKITKFHFYRVVGLSTLNFEELRTLICQISAIINSRPLCPLSESADDLAVLTPAHFLIGAPYTSVVEPDVTALNIGRLGRWQRVCYMHQQFWKKWHSEYLTLLQQRQKWRSSSPNLRVGDMVIIKDENQPPLKWPLARVIETIPGADGAVRVAVLKTAQGTVKRVMAKLCLLPIQRDDA